MRDVGHLLAQLQRLISLALLILLATSWPLWLARDEIPAIPWIGGLTNVPRGVDLGLLTGLTAVTIATILWPTRHWLTAQQWLMGGLLVALDQQRLQPWMYEFLLLLGVLACGRSATTLRCCRALVISIYFWSGVSKIDPGFVADHGQLLLGGLLDASGLSTALWTNSQRQIAAALMPAGELLIALLLPIRATRRFGLIASLLMHSLLFVAVGPWGLDHEPGVLIWNVYFCLQNLILFQSVPTTAVDSPALDDRTSSRFLPRLLTTLGVLLPALNPVGCWDNWPSWSVYSSHPGVVKLLVLDSDVSRLPASLQPWIEPPQPLQEWRVVRLDQWSYAVRNVPPYPQDRWKLAVARAVVANADLDQRAQLSVAIRDGWWRPTRTVVSVPTSPPDAESAFTLVNHRPRR